MPIFPAYMIIHYSLSNLNTTDMIPSRQIMWSLLFCFDILHTDIQTQLRFFLQLRSFFISLTMASLFDSLQIGKTFPTYEDVLILIDLIAEEQSFLLRIYDSCEISEYNKRISERNRTDEKWKFKFVFVTCSHYGKHNSRSRKGYAQTKVSIRLTAHLLFV